MTARLQRLLAEVRSDRRALTHQLDTLASIDFAKVDDPKLALAAWWLHHYTGIESILVRISRELAEGGDDGADWHQRLLDAAGLEIPGLRPALLKADTVSALHELRAFRHFVRHGYSAALDAERLLMLREHALELRPALDSDLDAAETWLNALASV